MAGEITPADSAEFQLVVNLDQFDRALAQAESRFSSAVNKIESHARQMDDFVVDPYTGARTAIVRTSTDLDKLTESAETLEARGGGAMQAFAGKTVAASNKMITATRMVTTAVSAAAMVSAGSSGKLAAGKAVTQGIGFGAMGAQLGAGGGPAGMAIGAAAGFATGSLISLFRSMGENVEEQRVKFEANTKSVIDIFSRLNLGDRREEFLERFAAARSSGDTSDLSSVLRAAQQVSKANFDLADKAKDAAKNFEELTERVRGYKKADEERMAAMAATASLVDDLIFTQQESFRAQENDIREEKNRKIMEERKAFDRQVEVEKSNAIRREIDDRHVIDREGSFLNKRPEVAIEVPKQTRNMASAFGFGKSEGNVEKDQLGVLKEIRDHTAKFSNVSVFGN